MSDPYNRVRGILGGIFAKNRTNETNRLDEKEPSEKDEPPKDDSLDDVDPDKSSNDSMDSDKAPTVPSDPSVSDDSEGAGNSSDDASDGAADIGGGGGGGSPEGGAGAISIERPSSPDNTDEPNNDDEEEEDSPKDIAPAPVQSDQQKIESMFIDSGDMDIDYSLSSDSNTRLARFKFTNASIDVSLLLSDIEKTAGVRTDELENRLSPAQRALYRNKNIELRKKYPEIDAREKNLIIYNSNVPFVHKDFSGKEAPISDEKVQEAYKKINKFMMKKYGRYWQDRHEAVDFITSIRVNFSEKESIRPNLSYVSDIFPDPESTVMKTIYFDEINIKIPKFVEELLKNNTDNEKFKKSSVFRSLVSSYLPGPTKANSVYAIIKPQEDGGADVENEDPQEPTDPSDEEPDESFGEEPDSESDPAVSDLDVDTSDITDKDIEDDEIEL